MKSVISASVIFILIVIMTVVSVRYVERVSDEMLQSLYKNEKYVAKNNWEYAEKEANYVIDVWQKNRVPMSVIFNHSVIDRIDASVENMKNTVKFKEKRSFYYEKSNLFMLVSSLKEQQKISVGNIM